MKNAADNTALAARAPYVLQVRVQTHVPRATARSEVRSALCGWLTQQLGVLVSERDFVQDHGGPLRWQPQSTALQRQPLQFSIAHAPGLSLIAIYGGDAVGVDLMHIQEIPETPAEMQRLLADYAGPQALANFAQQVVQSPVDAATLFANAWTALEARTKCSGLALSEWPHAKAEALPPLHLQLRTLDLPPGYVGNLAWKA